MEDDLCGHATLATAHALRQDARIESHVRFFTRSGVLTAALGDDGSITLDFPAADLAALPVPEGLAVALGAAPDGAMFSGSLRDAIAVFATEREVRDLLPDLHAVATLTRRGRIRGITATAPADTDADYDFVSRFFSPADGIPEDPVCGSAHTALGPYWASRLGRSDLVGFQASRRGGIVRTRVDGDRVKLTGCAVTVLDATLAGTSPEVGVCRSAHG